MSLIGRAKVKARRAKETYLVDFPQKRKFGRDVYYLHGKKSKKSDALNVARKLKGKGHFVRLTYNKTLKKWLIWRG